MRIDEAKYLLEKLLTMTISQTCLATQKEGSIREMENRMTQAMKQNTLRQQLLQHLRLQTAAPDHIFSYIAQAMAI